MLEIRPILPKDLCSCAQLAASSSLQAVYGFTQAGWMKKLEPVIHDAENLLFVAEEAGEIAGFAWVHLHGAFLAAPYLRFIAVAPSFQGRGVGTRLLEEFEQRTEYLGKDFFLLASDFNAGAQRFYEEKGYCKVGELADFAVAGVTELIMVKKNRKR